MQLAPVVYILWLGTESDDCCFETGWLVVNIYMFFGKLLFLSSDRSEDLGHLRNSYNVCALLLGNFFQSRWRASACFSFYQKIM